MLTLADDLDHFDGLESVQVFAPLSSVPVGISAALRRRVTTHEAAASRGACLETDVKWHLSTRELDAAPEIGATIRDVAGSEWRILRVEGDRAAGSWKCFCRNLAISERLGERITIQQAVRTVTPTGVPATHWIDLWTDLPARIQPLDAVVELRRGRRVARVTHHVYLAQPVVVDEQHRIVHDGKAYRVLGYESAERLDKPLVIRAELMPGG
jgi:head-tail adaptor